MLKKPHPALELKPSEMRKKRRPLRIVHGDAVRDVVRGGLVRGNTARGAIRGTGRRKARSQALDGVAISAAVLGVLMARATVLGVLWPFGPAYYAAIAITMPEKTVAVALALIMGAATTRLPGRVAVMTLSALLLSSVYRSMALRGKPGMVLKASLIAGAVGLSSSVTWAALSSASPYVFLMAGLEAMAIAGLTMAFITVAPLVKSPQRRLGQAEMASLCILAASATAGVSEIRIGPVELRNIVGSFVTLSLAHAGGAGIGAAAGACVGLVGALSRPMTPGLVGTQALAGLAAGILKSAGKVGSITGFALGALALTVPVESTMGLTKLVIEIAVAGGAFLATRLPRQVVWMLGQNDQEHAPQGPKLGETIAIRLHEFARILRELSRSYSHIAASDSGDRELPWHFERLAHRVCEPCEKYRTCWNGSFFKKYGALTELLKRVEASAVLKPEDLPPEFREDCPRGSYMVLAITYVADLMNAHRVWMSRAGEVKDVMALQLRGISEVVDGLAGEVRVMPLPPLDRPREMDYEISIARKAKTGSIICGDSVLHKETSEQKLVLILSDGMGTGPSAALESKATVALLDQLLDNGFDPDLAVEVASSFVRLKFPEDTFATVDMALVDLATGEGEFIKRSAAPSFIKRNGEVMVLTASSLPIGIVGQSEADKTRKLLKAGDMLVMLSDGAMQWVRSTKKDEPFANFVARLKVQHADEVSGRLLDKVLEAGKDTTDDVTIVAVRFLDARPKEPAD